jgi:hypothetical protein
MSQVNVIVVSPEEAYDGIAEFWCGAELIGVTILSEGESQLRIAARADGRPWAVDTTSLAHGLEEATPCSPRTDPSRVASCPVFAGAHATKGST